MEKLDDQTVFEAVKYFIAKGRTATATALAGQRVRLEPTL
jgi:hypothetical protein